MGRPVVIYIDAISPGGTASYALLLASGLVRRGRRVAAICSVAPAMADMRGELAALGVELHSIENGDASVLGRARRLLSFARVIRQFRGCELLLLMGYYIGGGAMAMAGAVAGAHVVIRADLQPPMPPITWRGALALRLKDRWVDRIVVGSEENKSTFVRLMGRTGRKIDVIHTGIDLDRYSAPPPSPRASDDPPKRPLVVGTVSRLGEERKGIRTFLEMAALVARGCELARFLIIGDGAERPLYEREAARLEIADRVTFAGWRRDVPAALGQMDVFVMPSFHEGGPIAVLEAMAMGRAVVATRVGMVPEVIDDGVNGLSVEPGDARAMAAAVESLLRDAELRGRLGATARAAALRGFSAEIMVDRYSDVLAGVAV